MIVTLLGVWALAQAPSLSCASGEEAQREARDGSVRITCSRDGKKLRTVVSDRGVRSSTELTTGVTEQFLESTGQRLSRSTAFRFGVPRTEPDQTWWPDGCVLTSAGVEGARFSDACARQRSDAPDGGVTELVAVIPPAYAATIEVSQLSTFGLPTARTDAGTVRVCLADAGPCEITGNFATVFTGAQALALVSWTKRKLMIGDRARRTFKPATQEQGVFIGGTELWTMDGGSTDLLNGKHNTVSCELPVRRLADGSLLCAENRGYRRVWSDRSRFCPEASLGRTLIDAVEPARPSVFLLARDADAQCLEVFDGLLDRISSSSR